MRQQLYDEVWEKLGRARKEGVSMLCMSVNDVQEMFTDASKGVPAITEFLGKPVAYWAALKAHLDSTCAEDYIEEITRLKREKKWLQQAKSDVATLLNEKLSEIDELSQVHEIQTKIIDGLKERLETSTQMYNGVVRDQKKTIDNLRNTVTLLQNSSSTWSEYAHQYRQTLQEIMDLYKKGTGLTMIQLGIIAFQMLEKVTPRLRIGDKE